MTKEELIEYFIELLGDNSVLEKYFTIDGVEYKISSTNINVGDYILRYANGRYHFLQLL